MSPAELKTTREACGLPVSWVAHQLQVDERSVRYWESGKHQPPDDFFSLIANADALISRAVRAAVEQANLLRNEFGAPHDVVFSRYKTDAELWRERHDMDGYPVTYHAAMIARATRALREQGFTVKVGYAG